MRITVRTRLRAGRSQEAGLEASACHLLLGSSVARHPLSLLVVYYHEFDVSLPASMNSFATSLSAFGPILRSCFIRHITAERSHRTLLVRTCVEASFRAAWVDCHCCIGQRHAWENEKRPCERTVGLWVKKYPARIAESDLLCEEWSYSHLNGYGKVGRGPIVYEWTVEQRATLVDW